MSGCDAVLRWGESRLIHIHRALRSGRIEQRKCPFWVCAVKGDAFQWVKGPPGDSLQPEAAGAVMEGTKWLKPSV